MKEKNKARENNSKQRKVNARATIKAKSIDSRILTRDVTITVSDTHFIVQTRSDVNDCREFSWFLLKKIEAQDKILNITFLQTSLKYQSDQISYLYDIILDILPRIFKTSELLNCGLVLSPNYPKPNCNSALLRLKQKIQIKNNPVLVNCYNSIYKQLTFAQQEVDFSKIITDANYIQPCADIIPLIPNITSLIINNNERDELYYSTDIAKDSGSIEHIQFKGVMSNYFEKFMKYLQNNKFSKITAFSFKNSKMTENHLETLLQYAKTTQLTSLNFTNAILPKALTYFFFTFLNDRNLSNLIELSLNSMQNLNFYAIFPSISSVTFLSIENCGLDITNFLSRSVKSKLPNCTTLNLSSNFCRELGFFDLEFPPKLTNLMLNNVEWGDNSLLTFFKSIDRTYDGGLRISLGNTKCSSVEWNKIFTYLPSIHPNLFISLIWDYNPINSKFNEFISNQKNLKYFSCSHSLSQEDNSIISLYAALANSPQLSHLVLQGDNEHKLGLTIESLFKFLKTNSKTLSYLDISNSFCGDSGIDLIKTFISGPVSPKLLIIDGTKPSEPESLVSLLKESLHSSNDTSISFPIDDFNYLRISKKLSEKQFDQIVDIYRAPEGNTDSIYDSPYFVYVENEESNFFPKYVTASYSTDIHSSNKGHEDFRSKRLFEMTKTNYVPEKVKFQQPKVSISKSTPKLDLFSDFTSTNSEETLASSNRAVGAPTVAFSVSKSDLRSTADNDSTNIGEINASVKSGYFNIKLKEIHEPSKPPPGNSGSPRRGIRNTSPKKFRFHIDISSSSSSSAKESSSDVLMTIDNIRDDKNQNINPRARQKITPTSSRSSLPSQPSSSSNKIWDFPIDRVEIPDNWLTTQQKYSIVESMKYLSKIQHNHYPN